MPDQRKTLLVATYNLGKLAELREFLTGMPILLTSLIGRENIVEVEETGTTFMDNARLKASGYARQARLPAIADDSGLEVEALDGRPGVLSARYGGADTGFDEKMAMLLREIEESNAPSRNARFVSSIAIADRDGRILHTAEGMCRGAIASSPRGLGGFGYDPLFIPDGWDLTFGELPGAVKGKISHRAQAFEQIMPFLRDFIVV